MLFLGFRSKPSTAYHFRHPNFWPSETSPGIWLKASQASRWSRIIFDAQGPWQNTHTGAPDCCCCCCCCCPRFCCRSLESYALQLNWDLRKKLIEKSKCQDAPNSGFKLRFACLVVKKMIEHIPQMVSKWWSFIVTYHGRMRKNQLEW